jgi:hypothetical protein
VNSSFLPKRVNLILLLFLCYVDSDLFKRVGYLIALSRLISLRLGRHWVGLEELLP